ncbi:unnamed protein product [Lepeophtheirus salmonis]|uniref:(salmon louse) hypothetical protein n=1 Tax=Lepeophtheirus salmonis TaxID=72036 RepID=A0A7R8CTI2_LEPSM|nr:unnamed protein product [Lepeophtheirus salmonis]CAF2890548.1 unnamed protein product [Lepeophtheirus salmonis]
MSRSERPNSTDGEDQDSHVTQVADSEGTWDYDFKPMPTYVLCIILMTSNLFLLRKNIRRAPFYIVSFGNALLLIASTILYENCKSYICEEVDYLRGLVTIEALSILSLITKYLVNLKKFHETKAPPDVLRQDWMNRLISKRVPTLGISDLIGASPDKIRNIVLDRQSEVISLMMVEIDELRLKIDQYTFTTQPSNG